MQFNVIHALKCYILCLLLGKYGGYWGLYGYWGYMRRSLIAHGMTRVSWDDKGFMR